jgi:hypothetical protein
MYGPYGIAFLEFVWANVEAHRMIWRVAGRAGIEPWRDVVSAHLADVTALGNRKADVFDAIKTMGIGEDVGFVGPFEDARRIEASIAGDCHVVGLWGGAGSLGQIFCFDPEGRVIYSIDTLTFYGSMPAPSGPSPGTG